MSDNILITKNSDIDKNGIKFFLFLKPLTPKTLLVINKLVNDIVVLAPTIRTLTIATSCDPKPVNRTCEENGVINVHPDIT